MTNGYGVELRHSGESTKKGMSFCLTKDNTVLRFENIYDYDKGYENGLAGSYAIKNHASQYTDYGVGTANNYGHCKTINNLTTSSYRNGEALSAYQGNVIKNSIDNFMNSYIEKFTEGSGVGSEKIRCVSVEQPSTDSRDAIEYFKAWCSSHKITDLQMNAINMFRLCDKNGIWYFGPILETRNGINGNENLCGTLTNTYGDCYSFCYLDSATTKWSFYHYVNNETPTGLQIGAGKSYSFVYSTFLVLYIFRETYYYEAVCDNWGKLILIRKSTGFDIDVSVTASTKTLTIVNNETMAVNAIITYQQSILTI